MDYVSIATIVMGLLIASIIYGRKYPICLIIYDKYFSWMGIQYGKNIYTLSSVIQTTDTVFFDLIMIHRTAKYLDCYQLLHRNKICIPLVFLQPGYFMRYIVDGEQLKIPYYEGTPFSVDVGELVFYKSKKSYFGISYVEVNRSTYWPINLM